jgi:hypothetical protein
MAQFPITGVNQDRYQTAGRRMIQTYPAEGQPVVAQVAQLRDCLSVGFPGKRHTIKQLEFQPLRLLTDRLQVRVLPGEPTSILSTHCNATEHSVASQKVD